MGKSVSLFETVYLQEFPLTFESRNDFWSKHKGLVEYLLKEQVDRCRTNLSRLEREMKANIKKPLFGKPYIIDSVKGVQIERDIQHYKRLLAISEEMWNTIMTGGIPYFKELNKLFQSTDSKNILLGLTSEPVSIGDMDI